MAVKKTSTRSRKQPEFKVLADVTYGNRERLGRALMRCIEYLEVMGYGATMVGGEENRTCMDIILKGVQRYGRAKRKSVEVTIKPDMYNGTNSDIKQLISTPVFDGSMRYDVPDKPAEKFEISPGQFINLPMSHSEPGNPEEFLRADYSYYDLLNEYGYRMPITEAVVKFFLLNPNASPEQKYCNLPIASGSTTVKPGMQHSCLSDIIDLSRSSAGRYHPDPDSDSQFAPETLPETIDMINKGALCQHIVYNTVRHYPQLMPCLEKILWMSNDAIAQKAGQVEYYIGQDHPFVYSMDKYNWSLKSLDGSPVIQKFINGCSTINGNYLNYLCKYLLVRGSAEERAGFVSILSEDYDFKNTEFEDNSVMLKDGHKRMTGFDYVFTTGVMMSYVALSPLRTPIFLETPLCRYDNSDNMYPCFAKVLNNAQMWIGNNPPASLSGSNYSQFLDNTLAGDGHVQMMFERGVREGDCSVISDGSASSTFTCMDMFVNTVAHSQGGAFSNMFSRMNESYPISDMSCVDEINGGRSINCLDKLIGVMSTSAPLDILASQGVLLNLPDCTDANGAAITCIDKLSQRQELFVYAKYRARHLRRIQDNLELMIKQAPRDDPVRDVVRKELEYVNSMMMDVSEASLQMNIGGDIGFRTITKNYDVGALKSHIPSKVTDKFRKVIEDDLASNQKFMNMPEIKDYALIDTDRIAYTRELLKTLNEGTSREYPIVSRMMRVYDANYTMMPVYSDFVGLGVTDLLATDRMDSLTLNAFECKDRNTGKTISCIQKLIDVSENLAKVRRKTGDNPSGYVDEYTSLFALRDMYKPAMCESNDGGKRSCLEYVFENMINSGNKVAMNTYVAIMSSKDFSKYADTIIRTPGGNNMTMRDVVCRNVSLFDLGDYLVKTKTLAKVGNDRPRFDHLALSLHSICNGCDKIKDPLDRRVCMDGDLFNEQGGFLSDRDLDYTSINEKGSHYGGYAYEYSQWANEYAKDPEAAMSSFRYGGSDDLFGLAGVYNVTYDPSKIGMAVNVERFDYDEVVRGTVFPAIRKAIGKKLPRYKKYKDVAIYDFDLDDRVPNNFAIVTHFDHTDESGNRVSESEISEIPAMFAKGGIISSEDIKSSIIKLKSVSEAIKRISTMKSAKVGDNTLTLVISNRPSDFMRASTGQPWTSCMGFRQFPGLGGLNRALLTKMSLGSYIAYVAGDELESGWKARMILVPGMDTPHEKHPSGRETNMFRIEEPYGLPTFTTVMQAALSIIMRENGYNAPDSYNTADHGGRLIQTYIYNSSSSRDYTDTKTRRGGDIGGLSTGSYGGTRYNMLMGEIWKESTEKCIEKVTAGSELKIRDDDDEVHRISTVDDCEFLGDRAKPNQKGQYKSVSYAVVNSLYKSGLLGKDLERNFRFTAGSDRTRDFFMGYDGILKPDHVITAINDDKLARSRQLVKVEKIRPLATVRGRNASR